MRKIFKSSGVSYKILECIGEGLHGTVYKAERSDPFRHLRQIVALKLLKSENSVELWKKEFASLEKLNCKHCVRVYGFEWIGRRPALVLECVHGVSLRQLWLSGPLGTDFGKEILAQVQQGLKSLAENRIAHGDLSPNNVMIDAEGCVKLLDFGWGNGRDACERTTLDFAAPELLNGAKPSLATDLYSLGVLEEMLLHVRSNRLSEVPAERTPLSEKSCPKRRKELSELVDKVLRAQKRLRTHPTRSMQLVPKAAGRFRPRFAAAALALVCAPRVSPLSVSDSFLRVRSDRWLMLDIDGNKIGFAPQDIPVSCDRKHRLSWKTADASGEIIFRLQKGENRAFYDRDFRH